MACGACGPAVDQGQQDMYKQLEAKVKAEEAEKKRLEKERRVSQGLPVVKGEFICYGGEGWRCCSLKLTRVW